MSECCLFVCSKNRVLIMEDTMRQALFFFNTLGEFILLRRNMSDVSLTSNFSFNSTLSCTSETSLQSIKLRFDKKCIHLYILLLYQRKTEKGNKLEFKYLNRSPSINFMLRIE